MVSQKNVGTGVAIIGVIVAALSIMALSVPGQVTGGRIVTTWAQDTTCGYGFTAVDCWDANVSLSLDGPALTVTDKLTEQSGQIYSDDMAFTFTVKNEGPIVYDAFGNEIPQPIYAQVTFVDTITSDEGVPLPIVNVNSLDQMLIAFRDFSDNSFITEQRQSSLGTLAFGASDTAKLCIQLRPAAFAATSLAAGQTYYIRGTIGNQGFTISVYVNAVG